MAESRAFALRALIEERNIPHRGGMVTADGVDGYIRSLIREAHELYDEWSLEARKEEIADVFVMTCAIVLRFGLSFADLDALAVEKLHLRFPGSADAEAAATR